MQHYDFGSSTAARTNACPSWFQLSKDIPRTASSYAVDGDIIHGMLEMAMLNDGPMLFGEFLGDDRWGAPVTQDHIEMADAMWAAVNDLLDEYDARDCEPEVTGVAAADVGGTIDLIADCGERALVIDYKTGRGVQVSPENNAQILFATAVCAIDSSGKDLLEGKDQFTGVIIQPDKAGIIQVKKWDFTLDDVTEFWENHKKMIVLARQGGAEMHAGDHCKFCPAAPTCPVKTGEARRALARQPDDAALLAENMAMVKDLEAWCSEVTKAVMQQLEKGIPVEGYKLVAKQARGEHWTDEELMFRRLSRHVGGKKNLLKTAPVTPAQARKLLQSAGKKPSLVDKLAERNDSSGTTVAPESDKRQAVLPPDAMAEALASAMAVAS